MLPSTNNNYKRGRENETEEQRLSHLAKQRTRTENNRANETSLETQQRHQRDREHHARRERRMSQENEESRLALILRVQTTFVNSTLFVLLGH